MGDHGTKEWGGCKGVQYISTNLLHPRKGFEVLHYLANQMDDQLSQLSNQFLVTSVQAVIGVNYNRGET